MNTAEIIITFGLVGLGFSLMILRDYLNMRNATRKNKNSVEQFIQKLDNHPPTPYDEFIANKND